MTPDGHPNPTEKKSSMHRIAALLLLIALAIACRVALAEDAATAPEHPDARIMTAAVTLDGRVLFQVRGLTSYPAEKRAADIRERIAAIARDAAVNPDSLRIVEVDGYTVIMAGKVRLVSLIDADARLEDVERRTLARYLVDRIAIAMEDYRRDRSPEVLWRHAGESVVALLALAAAVALTIWLARHAHRLFEQRFRDRIRTVGIQSFQILRAERIHMGLRAVISATRVAVIAIAGFLCLDFVLDRFPWTRGFAAQLADFALRPLNILGEAFVAEIPDLIFLAVLAFAVHLLLGPMKLFSDAVERGSVTLGDFEPEWAHPTYKIVRVVIVVLALVVAYPYIPGSGSDAFKGISLFIGVVVSLGSSSAISNLIAGIMITYRRAFRIGDRVRIGDVTGDVTAIRMQVTHLRTVKNEQVTIPNSTILNGQVVNYSTLAAKEGLILHTTVGIGYETPWRQVEALLRMAAGRTAGLASEPAPFVQHRELGDFCVTYELNAYCNDAKAMNRLYTELHRNILDVFNEYGVQIMTPAYEDDPDQAKVVPKDLWYAAPASPEKPEKAA